jgi:hypothetical protein
MVIFAELEMVACGFTEANEALWTKSTSSALELKLTLPE